MAAASDSNDASDIFWPGYVDAVTNLAINLLFVIAVMSIVVISSILQMARMKPDNNDSEKASSTAKFKMEKKAQDKDTADAKSSASSSQADQSAPSAENVIKQQAEKIAKLEAENKQLKLSSDSKKTVQARKEQPGGTDDQNIAAQVISAADSKYTNVSGENQILPLSAGGILVVYEKDVLNLSEKETEKLIGKLSEVYSLKNTNWQIRVNVPKGFSESSRIGYYRVNDIRNILLKHNVPSSAISMRVLESTSESANNARILVKAVQP